MRKFLLILLLFAVPSMAQTLSLTQSGSGNSETITVISSGQFKLVWESADNWGLAGWYDLVNDPSATTNLASPVYSVNGSAVPCATEDGLAQYVFYAELDEKQFMRQVSDGCPYSAAARTITVITNTPSLVVLESTSIPVIGLTGPSSKLSATMRYYIYPNGKIYVRDTVTASSPITLGYGTTPSPWNDFVMVAGLPNSKQTGTDTPDSQSVGWVRATTTQNPYDYTNYTEPYLYTYWGSSSGAFGFGSSMTPKASLMIVPNPNNAITSIKQGKHTWGCGANCGVTRWGYIVLSSQNLTAGQSVIYDWLIQLGTVGSTALPNMTVAPPANCTTCSTIANAYIADPTPPAGGALLTGMTPNNYTTPSGWTVTATESFEAGACAAGSWCGGNFVTDRYHNDGNGAHNHALERQFGTDDCNGCVFGWNKFLPVGTREAYVSWYEFIEDTFRMNDEMFLIRFHWDVGNGQPSNRESVLDYFQNSNEQYNSTDATLLWNIQWPPGAYYQNKLPSNTRGDTTNFPVPVGSFVQKQLYTKFSTTSPAVAIGSVTLNTTNKTYTCAACDWVSLGAHVGDSPHFSGFSDGAANGIDWSAGTYSYFITAVSGDHKTITVTGDTYNGWTNQTANVTVQIDHADGAYSYYENGILIGTQANMINPGYVDFSLSNTTLSIGETYSKLIWRNRITNPNPPYDQICETSAPFTGSCATGIVGCGYQQIPHGWNASGMTRTAVGQPYNVPIDCTAGSTNYPGTMPNPPVFKRYLDDVIVLTKAASADPIQPSANSGVRLCTH